MANLRSMSPEEKEAYHREAESQIRPVSYVRPPSSGKPKDFAWMSRSDKLLVLVQVLKEGGENNLHYHLNSETVWLVLKGRVRFYGINDTILGEYGPMEGIFMPEGARYWFEKVGPEDLEIQQIVAMKRTEAEHERINVEKHKDWMDDAFLQVYESERSRR